jgi:hypothetical protein
MKKKLGMAISGRNDDVRKAIQKIIKDVGPKKSISEGMAEFCIPGISVTRFEISHAVKISHPLLKKAEKLAGLRISAVI